jgi:hypothetical protein
LDPVKSQKRKASYSYSKKPINGNMSRKSKISVHYQYFDTLKELCDDDEDWYKIFDDASNGILRTGFKINNNKLIYRGRGRVFEVMLTEDPTFILEECKKLFRKAGIKTKNEIKNAKEKMKKKRDQGWSSIRRTEDKHFYLQRYIVDTSKRLKLSEEEIIDLRHRIFMGILTGNIANESILFRDGKIVDIALDDDFSDID